MAFFFCVISYRNIAIFNAGEDSALESAIHDIVPAFPFSFFSY